MLLGPVSTGLGVRVSEMPCLWACPRGVLAFEMYPDRGRAPEVSLVSSLSTFVPRCLALTVDSSLEVSRQMEMCPEVSR